MARTRARFGVLALLIPWLVVGCGEETVTGPREPGIEILFGAGATDTVGAPAVHILGVEVRGEAGRPAAGAFVRFTALPTESSPPPFKLIPLRVSSVETSFFNDIALDTTDDRGRASVSVRFGQWAGIGRLVVSIATLGLADTVTYTVLPGAAARVAVAPLDTSMTVGRSITLRPVVTDRFGNARSDPIAVSPLSGGVTVVGNIVTAHAVGMAEILTQAAGFSDTAIVAVVPAGVLAFAAGEKGVATTNIDGTDFRTLGLPSDYVRWAPDGTAIAFDSQDGPARIVTMTGEVRAVRQSIAGAETDLNPVFSPDGAWIYLSVAEAWESFRLWRVRPDGTEAGPLNSSSPENDVYASPSPDGTRLVYVRRMTNDQDYLRILDLTTGAVDKIDVPGHAPAWSPVGDLIAYVDVKANSVLKVMRPDGTEQRQVSPPFARYDKSVQWSPDGRWLVAVDASLESMHLINVASGELISQRFYRYPMRSPAWKP